MSQVFKKLKKKGQLKISKKIRPLRESFLFFKALTLVAFLFDPLQKLPQKLQTTQTKKN